MQILVCYDVATDTAAGRKRLRKVARVCVDHGQRVQKSVFEISVNQVQYEQMLHRLLEFIDQEEDSLRVYRLREPKERYLKEYGVNVSVDYDHDLLMA
ncbi:MAG: CRISPR-associated endonuclease Cas2 [Desulforudis sp.]|nr:MAG: CRISPR-associated endonuclease Cas2 [Desulforudis sp.]